MRCLNLYGGPGIGKSTTAAALFAELKYRGYNTELVLEYAKEAAWEGRGKKIFAAQEYIFAKQHFRIAKVIDEVEFIITDAPLLLSLVYAPQDYLPSLRQVVRQAYDMYENIDVFLRRSEEKAFNPKGRLQNEEEANQLDVDIYEMLMDEKINVKEVPFSRRSPHSISEIMHIKGWIK